MKTLNTNRHNYVHWFKKKKISMQFMKFLDMTLTSASGVRVVTAGEKAGSQFLMEGSSTCNNDL